MIFPDWINQVATVFGLSSPFLTIGVTAWYNWRKSNIENRQADATIVTAAASFTKVMEEHSDGLRHELSEVRSKWAECERRSNECDRQNRNLFARATRMARRVRNLEKALGITHSPEDGDDYNGDTISTRERRSTNPDPGGNDPSADIGA